jgi:endonuclease/exonuclease/phosphatase (EEP) superfamily protein YafD
MKILSLNCQKGYQPNLKDFIKEKLRGGVYDFLLLQETTADIRDFFESERSYAFVTAHNETSGEQSHQCIVHRREFTPHDLQYISFASMHADPVLGYRHPNYGLLFGVFEHKEKRLLIASMHLHSGVFPADRKKEITRIKEILKPFSQKANLVIVGGDCNFGLKREVLGAARILAPELVCVTNNIGGTLDSKYTEYLNQLTNKVAFYLAKVGVNLSLPTDHIFVDVRTSLTAAVSCKKLPDRISDHRPVEMSIETGPVTVASS